MGPKVRNYDHPCMLDDFGMNKPFGRDASLPESLPRVIAATCLADTRLLAEWEFYTAH